MLRLNTLLRFFQILFVKISGALILVSAFTGVSFCQSSIGKMEVTNYSKIQYAGGMQNWAIAQDKKGRMYVGNNEGLLTYDGTNWQTYPVPNKTILRSIAFGEDGKLYAGAQDEFGYYAPDKAGRLSFISLKRLLPDSDKTFADVWNIQQVNRDVFFRTNQKIIRLHNNTLSVYPSTSMWLSMYQHNSELLAQDAVKGLLVFRDNAWQTLMAKSALPEGFIITDIIPYHHDTSLLSTTQKGLFLLSQNNLSPFSLGNKLPDLNVTSLVAMDENNFLAGTYSHGIYQINLQNNTVENITSKNDLQNNTVRCLYADRSGNLWAGLDNGVSFIAYNSAIKLINPQSFNNGGGYGIKVLNEKIFFALSTGLQWLPLTTQPDLSKISTEPEKILDGQTWNLAVINHQLLVGRDDGFWKISGVQATQVSHTPGYWTYQLIPNTSPAQIAAGNYTGIRLFHDKSGNFIDDGAIKDFTESSRYVETDDKNIWVSQPYRGVFKISLSNYAVTKYLRKNGLPSDLDIHVFKLKNKIVFATPKGIYEYNTTEDKIVPAQKYAGLFGQTPLRYLKEDQKGNIWFVTGKMLGVADFSTPKPVIHFIPELKNRILSGFENIYPYNTQNILVGAQSGFYHINYDKYLENIHSFKPYITLVQTIGNGDSIFYGGYGTLNDTPIKKTRIAYTLNSLHFSFAASVYGQQPVTEFSYYLDGFDNQWSKWSISHEKDYTNLPEGKYTFHIKARNSPTNESEEQQYFFSIAPPWYRTWWFFMFYIVGLMALIYGLYKFQEKKHRQKQERLRQADQKKFEDEQRELTYQHQIELGKKEKEVIRLQNENLGTEIEHKNAELASIAMNLVQKKEFLLKITEELNKLNKSGKNLIEPLELKKVLRSLASEENLDEEWEQFSIHFNRVHSNFLITLKNNHADLNAHDLKVCAYLRMNLTSKEMARLMSISVRGVEINRYRLRKKLQLQPKEDLFQYLLKLESSNETNTGNNIA